MSKTAFRSSVEKKNALIQAEKAFHRRDFKRCIEHSHAYLKSDPHHPWALRLNAYACMESGKNLEALILLQQVLEISPEDFENQLNAAKLNIKQNNHQQAFRHLKICQELHPGNYLIGLLQGECLVCIDRTAEAIQTYNQLIEQYPTRPEAYYKLANLLQIISHTDTALELVNLGIELMPDEIGLVHMKAVLFKAKNMHSSALKVFEHLESSPSYDLHMAFDHADTLRKLKKHEEALEKYNYILKESPEHSVAMQGMAETLMENFRFEEALNILLDLHTKNPAEVSLLAQIASVYRFIGDFTNAKHFLQLTFRANPYTETIAGSYLYVMSFLCDWEDYHAAIQIIKQDSQRRLSKPFPSVIYDNDPKANQDYAKFEINLIKYRSNFFNPIEKYSRKSKIRIGYYSSDFHTHATMMLIEGLLRQHDRNHFELYAFSLTKTPQDPSNAQFKKLFDWYYDVSDLSDNAVTLLSRQKEIDIAIDLKGFTLGSRTAIFAERAAPIQINYLGFPGTMGADFIDYLVADPYIITPENRPYFTEKIIYMPECYQPNTPQRPKPTSDAQRPSELPQGVFVYCSFNNIYKLTPDMFELWLKILRQTPNSVLWMLRTTAEAEKNLLDYVSKTDIDPSRLIFAPHLPEAQHLQRVSFADCFLDSFPCNAHTTASDAVWAGVPLITKSGDTFASRVAGSILTAVGIPELIVDNDADYEALALKVYEDRDYLKELKQRVKTGITTGPLYNAERYARHFEGALKQIYELHHQDAESQDIHIPNTTPFLESDHRIH